MFSFLFAFIIYVPSNNTPEDSEWVCVHDRMKHSIRGGNSGFKNLLDSSTRSPWSLQQIIALPQSGLRGGVPLTKGKHFTKCEPGLKC